METPLMSEQHSAPGAMVRNATLVPPALNSYSFGLPWESGYGYAQAIKVGPTVYISASSRMTWQPIS